LAVTLGCEIEGTAMKAIVQLSAYHFCHCFKQLTGLNPHQYVIRQWVDRAEIPSKDRKREIREGAIVRSFTESHFRHHLKRLAGLTPKRFSKSSQCCAKSAMLCKILPIN